MCPPSLAFFCAESDRTRQDAHGFVGNLSHRRNATSPPSLLGAPLPRRRSSPTPPLPRPSLLETRYAVEAAKAGYFFSVPPIICRSPGFQALVKAVPLESLLLETDSPALVRVHAEQMLPLGCFRAAPSNQRFAFRCWRASSPSYFCCFCSCLALVIALVTAPGADDGPLRPRGRGPPATRRHARSQSHAHRVHVRTVTHQRQGQDCRHHHPAPSSFATPLASALYVVTSAPCVVTSAPCVATPAPYVILQAPVKNTKNEPKNITIACDWIATLKNVPVEEVRRVVGANAQRLFPRAFSPIADR